MGKGKHGNHAKGRKTGRWNKEKMLSPGGYVKIRVGKSHPLSCPNGYCYEHKLVMVAALGRQIMPNEVIHHINGDKTDNRIENLEVVPRGEHNQHHNQEKVRNDKGQFIGKKKAGRLLDGKEWNQFPEVG